MVVIYADLGAKQLRQEAVATQIRQQHAAASMKQRGSAANLEEKPRMVSEMGEKPNTSRIGATSSQEKPQQQL